MSKDKVLLDDQEVNVRNNASKSKVTNNIQVDLYARSYPNAIGKNSMTAKQI